MNYPATFVERVKKEFSTFDFSALFDSGDDEAIGIFLACQVDFSIDAEKIVAAFREGREHEIREAAERAIRRKQLYRDWKVLRG